MHVLQAASPFENISSLDQKNEYSQDPIKSTGSFVWLDFIQTGALIAYPSYFCYENHTHLHQLGESRI